MEKQISELILEKLLMIEGKIGSVENRATTIENHIKDLKNELNRKIDEGFESLREAITFIGDKVFDNHEQRIKVLEEKFD